jgi:DNA modification methylase
MSAKLSMSSASCFQVENLGSIDWDFPKVATGYLTHGLHPYPAKFIPQIPHALIKELSHEGETVADIFCGSGTTLVESMLLNRNAIGIDANPIACLISKAKTTRFQPSDIDALYQIVKRAQNLATQISLVAEPLFSSEAFKFKSSAPRPSHKAIDFWFEPFVVEELAEALAWCYSLQSEASLQVALVAFSAIVVAVSKQDSDTRYVRRQKRLIPGDPLKRFARSLLDAIKAVEAFTGLVQEPTHCVVYNANILEKPELQELDLVVCSPPYPNAYSYHLYHMTRMVWLGMDQPKFKREEIGSHRKYSNKGPKGATAETFRSEMTVVFDFLSQKLRSNRYVCFVVGDSIIKGEKVSNVDLISLVSEKFSFKEVKRITRRMQDTKKAFNPAIGKIKQEQILILQKYR